MHMMFVLQDLCHAFRSKVRSRVLYWASDIGTPETPAAGNVKVAFKKLQEVNTAPGS